MNEAEIALKMAELALGKSRIELFDDAVKIGIPSIVAIAGIVSTYFLTRSGHKKDLKIENLRISHDTQKEIQTRTGDLIKSISLGLTELHQKTLAFATLLFAKLDMEKDGLPFPDKSRKELSALYQAYVDCLHESFAIEAQIYLLGHKNIDEQFVKYQTTVSELSKTFVPSSGSDTLEALQHKLLAIRDLREALFNSLSRAYLINEKPH